MSMNKFWSWTQNAETNETEMLLNGPIAEESWWGDEVTPHLFKADLAKHKGKNITVWINSPGGDVFAASQIYTALKEHKGTVTIKIEGYAISAASVIAMAGDRVLMSPTAIMMIHNPWSFAIGEAKDMEHAAEVLGEVKETIINAYAIKTGMEREQLSKLMDAETWMSANNALEKGFIDEVMYASTTTDNTKNSFSFSRLTVLNSIKAKLPQEQNNEFMEQARLNLYKLKIKEDI